MIDKLKKVEQENIVVLDSNSKAKIHYEVSPKHIGAHLFSVKLRISNLGDKDKTSYLLKIPRWIPGSYKIRDYARFITLSDDKTSVYKIRKLNSYTWKLDVNPSYLVKNPEGVEIEVEYSVYAFDDSVRGAYLDSERMFFNPCALLFDIAGYEDVTRTLSVKTPVLENSLLKSASKNSEKDVENDDIKSQKVKPWKIYTTLNKIKSGLYSASSYDELIDNPIIAAKRAMVIDFKVQDINHKMVLTNQFSDDVDAEKIASDLSKVCGEQINLFGSSPLAKYLFMATVIPNGYGGIEHENCTVLSISDDMLPHKNAELDNLLNGHQNRK